MYKEGSSKTAIELPGELTFQARMVFHHVADRLGLGSFTRGKGRSKFPSFNIL